MPVSGQIKPFFPRPIRWLAVLGMIALMMGVLGNIHSPYAMDFIGYWSAAKLTLAGNVPGAYDMATNHAMAQNALKTDILIPFGYPPTFLLVVLPFGLVDYWLGAAAWISLTLIALGLSVRRFIPEFTVTVFAFPPVLVCGIIAQNGFLTAAIMITALSALAAQPFTAGMIFGLLAIKPHLGLALPIALLAGREWRAIAGAATSVILLCALATLAFGMEGWQGFLDSMAFFSTAVTKGIAGWHKMASVFAATMQLGLPAPIGWALHGLCAGAGIVALWHIWSATRDPLARGAILAPATLLISPYLYVYDQIPLIVSLYWLYRQGVSRGLVLAVMLLPLISLGMNWLPKTQWNPAPLVTLVLLVLVWRQFRLENPSPLRRQGPV